MKTIILTLFAIVLSGISAFAQLPNDFSNAFLSGNNISNSSKTGSNNNFLSGAFGGNIVTDPETGAVTSTSPDGKIKVVTKGLNTVVTCNNEDGSVLKIEYNFQPDGAYTVVTQLTNGGKTTTKTIKYNKAGQPIEEK